MSLFLLLSKPVGLLAAILGLIQGLVWFVLTLLAVLTYTCAIDTTPVIAVSSNAFLANLLSLYFIGADCPQIGTPVPIANILTADEMFAWMIVNMVFNFIWMAASIYYLVELCRNPKPVIATTVFVGVASAVIILDLATTIRFGVNYGTVKGYVDADLTAVTAGDVASLATAGFLVSMAARGYILWLVNDALVGILIVVIIRGHKVSKATTRNLSRQASFVNPTVNRMWPDDDDKTYHQPAATRDAWEPVTPTQVRPLYPYSSAASQQLSPTGSLPRHNNTQAYVAQPRQQQPVLILQDPPKGHSHQQYPKHIPDPDYSPVMSRSNMLPEVVLRKPPARIAHVGRTVF